MRPPCYPRSLLHRGRDTIRWTDTRPTTREVDLTNYHAICRGDIRATNTILETPQTRIEDTDLDPWSRQKARGTVLLDATGEVGIVVTRVPAPPQGNDPSVRTHGGRDHDDEITRPSRYLGR